MEAALIGAFSAVRLPGWRAYLFPHNQPAQYRRDFLSRQFAQRENLYSEFINEAAPLQVDSLEQELVEPSTLVVIYALGNRIRQNASDLEVGPQSVCYQGALFATMCQGANFS